VICANCGEAAEAVAERKGNLVARDRAREQLSGRADA